MLAVLSGAGLREAELTALTLDDLIHGEGGYALHVKNGKGRKSRTVPIRPDVAALLAAYLEARCKSADVTVGREAALFVASDRAAGWRGNSPLRPEAIDGIVERWARRAGIERRITPHSLRHTCAIRSRRYGANIAAVSKVLGHASVSTTMTYLDQGQAEIREQLRACRSRFAR